MVVVVLAVGQTEEGGGKNCVLRKLETEDARPKMEPIKWGKGSWSVALHLAGQAGGRIDADSSTAARLLVWKRWVSVG